MYTLETVRNSGGGTLPWRKKESIVIQAQGQAHILEIADCQSNWDAMILKMYVSKHNIVEEMKKLEFEGKQTKNGFCGMRSLHLLREDLEHRHVSIYTSMMSL